MSRKAAALVGRGRGATIAASLTAVLALSGSGFAVGAGSASGAGGPSATVATSHPAAAPPMCRRLGARLGQVDSAAGTTFHEVRVTNRSAHRCRVGGSARVAFANKHHIMVGWPASPDPNPRTVVLRPGRSTHFAVGIPEPGNFPKIDCIPHNAHLLRIKVAADPTPSTLPLDAAACMTRHGRAHVTAYGV